MLKPRISCGVINALFLFCVCTVQTESNQRPMSGRCRPFTENLTYSKHCVFVKQSSQVSGQLEVFVLEIQQICVSVSAVNQGE